MWQMQNITGCKIYHYCCILLHVVFYVLKKPKSRTQKKAGNTVTDTQFLQSKVLKIEVFGKDRRLPEFPCGINLLPFASWRKCRDWTAPLLPPPSWVLRSQSPVPLENTALVTLCEVLLRLPSQAHSGLSSPQLESAGSLSVLRGQRQCSPQSLSSGAADTTLLKWKRRLLLVEPRCERCWWEGLQKLDTALLHNRRHGPKTDQSGQSEKQMFPLCFLLSTRQLPALIVGA